MKRKLWLLLFAFSISFLTKTAAQSADLILTNGKVFTSDTSKPFVQALAIKGNKIMAVGTNTAVAKLASAKTKKIDLKGKTVVPGFNDAHDHLGWLAPVGKSFFTEFSVQGPSKDAVIDSLTRLVKQASPNQWIQGTIGLIAFNDTSIRRRLLDSIAPNNPVALQIMWGHGMIVNSKALNAVNISDTASDPLSGWYERTAGSTYITGALYEGSQFPIWQALTISEPDNILKQLRSHADEQLTFGITTVQNMSANFQGTAAKRFFSAANLPVRTRIIAMPGTTAAGRSLAEWQDVKKHIAPLTYVSGIKYVIDGTPLEQTALMTKPYPNGWHGKLNFPTDTIKQILREALASDRQLLMHVVGDSATKIVLQLMKELASGKQWKSKRVRIEHGSGVQSEDVAKDIRNMGIILVHTPQYGMDLPLRSRLEMGIPIAIGPDAIINPFLGIMFMTSQQAAPKENISREQAVIAYTKGSAYAEFTEREKGTLAKGMLADLAVLSQDIFTIPVQQLPTTRSIITIIDGKIAYQK
ncbi:MAG TPA: amidohydrolase family protein [Chitinophagaceae bacterium]|nr:amidohydrolase family protein [Chitinophagaceae bacterium]